MPYQARPGHRYSCSLFVARLRCDTLALAANDVRDEGVGGECDVAVGVVAHHRATGLRARPGGRRVIVAARACDGSEHSVKTQEKSGENSVKGPGTAVKRPCKVTKRQCLTVDPGVAEAEDRLTVGLRQIDLDRARRSAGQHVHLMVRRSRSDSELCA